MIPPLKAYHPMAPDSVARGPAGATDGGIPRRGEQSPGWASFRRILAASAAGYVLVVVVAAWLETFDWSQPAAAPSFELEYLAEVWAPESLYPKPEPRIPNEGEYRIVESGPESFRVQMFTEKQGWVEVDPDAPAKPLSAARAQRLDMAAAKQKE